MSGAANSDNQMRRDDTSGPEPDDRASTDGGTVAGLDPDPDATLPDADGLPEATTGPDGDSREAADTEPAAAGGDRTRVLEFTLDGERYCLDISYIEEIVKDETVTRVPNTPSVVEGVVDLRGQITTVVDPKVPLGKEGPAGDRIVVFDADATEEGEHVGWAVDDVERVAPVPESRLNDPPGDADHVNAVIDREDDGLVVWTTPSLVLDAVDG